MKKGNIKNLRVPTSEVAREIGAKGGRRKAELVRERKTMQQIAQMMLRHKAPKAAIKELKALMPDIPESDIDIGAAMLHKQVQKALNDGDLKAAEFVRDTSGEKPVERIATTDSDGNDVTTIIFEGVEPTAPQDVGNGG